MQKKDNYEIKNKEPNIGEDICSTFTNQSFSDKFLKLMVFVMKRIQRNKIVILDVDNKDKPVVIEQNWEI
jgi:hypothetical protein